MKISCNRRRAESINLYAQLLERALEGRHHGEDADRSGQCRRACENLVGGHGDIVASGRRVRAHGHHHGLACLAQCLNLAKYQLRGEHAPAGTVDAQNHGFHRIVIARLTQQLRGAVAADFARGLMAIEYFAGGNHDADLGVRLPLERALRAHCGEILDGNQPPGKIGGDSTADLLRQARYDNAVKAVVLRVDSPGGSMFASELILREVQALRKAGKPVVVSMSTYAASGGYYISAAANQIFASPTTLTGSIGVFSVVPTFQRTLEKLGVKVDGLGTTPLAGDLRLDRPLDAATRQILQVSVNHAYDDFLHRVSEGRKKSVQDIDNIAQGRVWAGIDAQRIGLVDHLGGLKDATDAAAKLAELGADYSVDYIEPELSLREQLLLQLRSQALDLGQIAGLIPAPYPLERALDPILEQARSVAALNDPRGLYAYCWCMQPLTPRKILLAPR